MSHNDLTLEEMISIAKKVPKWSPSGSCVGCGIYEGDVDGLKVFIEHSVRDRFLYDFWRIEVSYENESIGYSEKLVRSNGEELVSLYNRIDDSDREERWRHDKEQQVADGLKLARQILS